MALTPAGTIDLPPFRPSAFDHGDVHLASGRLFVAHTAAGSVEVVDTDRRAHLRSIPGCPEASGVLCAQERGVVFAAARGAGKVLAIDATSLAVLGETPTGPRPNGLSWDGGRGHVLVLDVDDLSARLLDPSRGKEVARLELPGRPRWCVYDRKSDRFLVNVREPACVAVLAAEPFALVERWAVSTAGPHGLDLDEERSRAFVASDGGAVSVIDTRIGGEIARVPISGPPDAIWFSPRLQRLYVAIGDPGLIEVVDCEAATVCERFPTERGAHTTAFDGRRGLLHVFLPDSCRALVLREG